MPDKETVGFALFSAACVMLAAIMYAITAVG